MSQISNSFPGSNGSVVQSVNPSVTTPETVGINQQLQKMMEMMQTQTDAINALNVRVVAVENAPPVVTTPQKVVSNEGLTIGEKVERFLSDNAEQKKSLINPLVASARGYLRTHSTYEKGTSAKDTLVAAIQHGKWQRASSIIDSMAFTGHSDGELNNPRMPKVEDLTFGSSGRVYTSNELPDMVDHLQASKVILDYSSKESGKIIVQFLCSKGWIAYTFTMSGKGKYKFQRPLYDHGFAYDSNIRSEAVQGCFGKDATVKGRNVYTREGYKLSIERKATREA